MKALNKAASLYEAFHGFEPVDVGDMHASFSIPNQAFYVGEAKVMFYFSDKRNPDTGEDEGWISYYHPHEGRVRMYLTDDSQGGELRNIPSWICNTEALVRLGDCEGFEFVNLDGREVEAKGKSPLPEWYAIPSGKALLVVQSKRKVLAIVWGGDLRVEWRGVIG